MIKLAKRAPPPMPAFVEPCLATLVAEPPDSAQWAHEIKFDGYRLQARIDSGKVRLLTRSGLDWTEKFSGLAHVLLTLKVSSAIIDGEVVVEDERGASSFVELVSDLKARNSARMVYLAFDLMFLDGADTRALPLAERKAQLKRLFARRKKGSQLRYSDHVQGNGAAMLAESCKLGLEGIISKRLDKPYRSGRGVDWLKSKCIQTDEFVVAGYLDSTAIQDTTGALVVGFYDGRKLIYAGRVGTGFNRRVAGELWKQLQKLRKATSPFATPVDAVQAKGVIWVKPSLVAQIEYRAWTGDGILRHATFKALREDKPARHVRRPSSSR
jgi:bifunctional non-homologous end joining protein LigD